MNKNLFAALALGVLLLLFAPAASFGQAVYGNITGTVTDSNGAAVPQAKVTITDTGKGVSFTTTTNESGNYTQSHLIVGIYEVRVAATGALHSFGAVDNVAQALSLLPTGAKSWFGRRDAAGSPDLEYRTCATSTKADAKAAAERMIGRRETYMSGAA